MTQFATKSDIESLHREMKDARFQLRIIIVGLALTGAGVAAIIFFIFMTIVGPSRERSLPQ